MAIESLKEALATLKSGPFFWLIGIVSGIASAAALYVTLASQMYYNEAIMVFYLLLIPFFIAGAFGTLTGERTPASFIESGKKYYFRVLLPTALVIFVTVIIGVLLSAAAMASAALSTIFFVAMFVFLILTYFYDAAAVFDNCRVYESLKKSAEFVLADLGRFIAFALVNLAVVIMAGIIMILVWGMILTPLFEPVIYLQPEEIEAMFSTPEQLVEFLGDFGVIVTSLIYGIFTLLVTPFMYAYKACFYRSRGKAKASPLPVKEEEKTMQGEYDEKGRWYKY